MAAQEYFNMGQPNGNTQPQAAPPAPRPVTNLSNQSGPNPPYPLYDGPPPPYSPGGLRPDGPPTPQGRTPSQSFGQPEKQTTAQHRLSQQFPPPQPRAQARPVANGTSNGHVARPSLSQSQQEYDNQFRPPVRQQHSYYPPEKQAWPQSGPPYVQQQQQQQLHPSTSLPVQSPYQNGYGDRKGHSVSFAPGRPQERYPSRSRSESRSRSRSRERNSRPAHRNKKSSGLNTFLGAGGGAILGDAIFPGLGTLGGALLGGFGGHEYDKNKKRARSHEVRPRDRRYSDEYDHRPSRR